VERAASDPGGLPRPACPLASIGAAFGALGRAVLVLDDELLVLYASPALDRLAGAGAVAAARGRPAADVLGAELFGRRRHPRRALARGEPWEGSPAELRREGSLPLRVLVDAAPLLWEPSWGCGVRRSYLVVVRPVTESADALPGAEEDRHRLLHALAAHRWRREATAAALGVSRTTLWRRMREAGLTG
jgi:PAS domain-containing protein